MAPDSLPKAFLFRHRQHWPCGFQWNIPLRSMSGEHPAAACHQLTISVDPVQIGLPKQVLVGKLSYNSNASINVLQHSLDQRLNQLNVGQPILKCSSCSGAEKTLFTIIDKLFCIIVTELVAPIFRSKKMAGLEIPSLSTSCANEWFFYPHSIMIYIRNLVAISKVYKKS